MSLAARPTNAAPASSDSGRFLLGPLLHSSPSGEIRRGWERESGTAVLLKSAHDPALLARESKALRRLAGTASPRLLAEDSLEGRSLLVVEALAGETLEAWLRRDPDAPRRPSFPEVTGALRRGLEALHDRGVLHLDIKPSNIWIEEGGRILFLDFACARLEGEVEAGGCDFLTLGFAAPDLLEGALPSRASDLYGLGASLYWAAAGRAPRAGESEAERRAALEEAGLREDLIAPLLECLAAASASEHEDVPPTVRVRRRALPPKDAAPGEPGARRGGRGGGGVRLLAWLLALLLLAGAGGAGAWLGWPFYERHYKKEWIVDPLGGGDALTIAEVLERGGEGITILLGDGEHQGALLMERSVTLRAAPGLSGRPVILAGEGGCLTVMGGRLTLEGIAFNPAEGPEGTPLACLSLSGGEAELSDVVFADLSMPALLLSAGARLRLSGADIRDQGADAILLRQGAQLFTDEVTLERTDGFAVRAETGGSLTGRGLRISETAKAGIFLTEGATAVLSNSEIIKAGGSGLEAARGAESELFNTRIVGAKAAGIYLYEGSALRLERSQISESGLSGLVAEGADRLVVETSQIIANAEHGALLLEVRAGEVARSELSLNKASGIVAGPRADLDLVANVLEGNEGEALIDARPPRPEPAPEPTAVPAPDASPEIAVPPAPEESAVPAAEPSASGALSGTPPPPPPPLPEPPKD